MRQAIETKYLGPTNFRGSRVKATTGSGLTLTVGWDYALNPDENHQNAAIKLAEKLGWSGMIQGGSTLKGYAFVFSDCDSYVIPESSKMEAV